MMSRSKPLVFRPVLPFKKGSKTSTAMADMADECLLGYDLRRPKEQIMLCGSTFKVASPAAGPRKPNVSPGLKGRHPSKRYCRKLISKLGRVPLSTQYGGILYIILYSVHAMIGL